jgi:peptidoglycan/LPS O-acetylase OafA/YrhL
MGGVLAFNITLVSKRRSLLPAALWPLVIAGVTGVFIALDPVMPSQVHRGWIMCFILGTSIPWFAQVTAPALKLGGHLIAKYSYGVYLSHVPALWFAFTVLRQHSVAVQWCSFAFLLTSVPVLLYHAVEAPGIAFGRSCAAALAMRSAASRTQTASSAPL